MKNNLLDIIKELLDNQKPKIEFEKKMTICKYLVPKAYPLIKYQPFNIHLNEKKLKKKGVKTLYSCSYSPTNGYNAGERGIAMIVKDDNPLNAYNRIENAISLIRGTFHYRKDIGLNFTL